MGRWSGRGAPTSGTVEVRPSVHDVGGLFRHVFGEPSLQSLQLSIDPGGKLRAASPIQQLVPGGGDRFAMENRFGHGAPSIGPLPDDQSVELPLLFRMFTTT